MTGVLYTSVQADRADCSCLMSHRLDGDSLCDGSEKEVTVTLKRGNECNRERVRGKRPDRRYMSRRRRSCTERERSGGWEHRGGKRILVRGMSSESMMILFVFGHTRSKEGSKISGNIEPYDWLRERSARCSEGSTSRPVSLCHRREIPRGDSILLPSLHLSSVFLCSFLSVHQATIVNFGSLLSLIDGGHVAWIVPQIHSLQSYGLPLRKNNHA